MRDSARESRQIPQPEGARLLRRAGQPAHVRVRPDECLPEGAVVGCREEGRTPPRPSEASNNKKSLRETPLDREGRSRSTCQLADLEPREASVKQLLDAA